MKRAWVLVAVTAFAAVFAAGCKGDDVTIEASGGTGTEVTGVTVTGHGEAHVAPDTGYFEVGVQVTAATVEAARDRAATLATAVIASIKQNGVDIGQNRLFEFLRQHGYLISRSGSDYNMPTQRSMDRGWFRVKERTITDPNGSISVKKTTLVTGKGQQYFVNLFLKQAETWDERSLVL